MSSVSTISYYGGSALVSIATPITQTQQNERITIDLKGLVDVFDEPDLCTFNSYAFKSFCIRRSQED